MADRNCDFADTSPIFFGWDLSSTVCAVTVVSDDRVRFVGSCRLGTVKDRSIKALRAHFFEFICDVLNYTFNATEVNDVVHVVEDRLGGFTRGGTSSQTLLKLAALNAVFSCEIDDMWNTPANARSCVIVHVHPMMARKRAARVGLSQVKNSMGPKQNSIELMDRLDPWIRMKLMADGRKPYDLGDIADSYVLAKVGRLLYDREQVAGDRRSDQNPVAEARPPRRRKAVEGRIRILLPG